MLTPLLATKLFRPRPHSDVVRRPRLTERLAGARHFPLTLLCAPPGYGKTTAVTAWLVETADEAPVAWLSMDADDNDLLHFWRYVLAALGTVTDALGPETVALLQSAPSLPPAVFLAPLINELAGRQELLYLVLDDYHLITASPIHESVTFLLERLPPCLHLILISRVDPPLPLARLRARRQLNELREADLRFTVAEATAFLGEVMGLGLSTAEVTALENRTEGWIAGLQLAALSLLDSSDPSAFIQAFTGSHRHIVDYLAEEVLARQPADTRLFLLQTSILERLTADLCAAVTGRPDSGEMLARLEQAHLFLVPLDGERRWYRYHHLFGDLLQLYLRREQLERIAEYHERAARWYEENGFINDAVHHAIQAGRLDFLATLIARHAMPVLWRGDVTVVQHWLDALPESAIFASARLSTIGAWLQQLRRQFTTLERYLAAAEAALPGAPADERRQLQGELLTIRSFVASEYGRFDEAARLAREAQRYLPSTDRSLHGATALALGHALYGLGDPVAGVPTLREAVADCQADGNVLGALFATGELVVLLVLQGRLREALVTIQEASGWAAVHHWDRLPPATVFYIRRADIAREQNDLVTAASQIETAIELGRYGPPITQARAHDFLARIRQAQGDIAGADAALEAVAHITRDWSSHLETQFFLTDRARLRLLQGRLDAAAQWAREIRPWDPAEPLNYLREFELLTLARLYIKQGEEAPAAEQRDDLLALLTWLRERAEAGGRWRTVLETLVLEAIVRDGRGDTATGLAALERALELAAPEGYVRLFLDEGAPVGRLLARVPRAHPCRRYAEELLAAGGWAVEAAGSSSARLARLPDIGDGTLSYRLIEPLSERELEVLALMADGYSNREIAERLVFTVATAKKHAEHIYGKLGVNSRMQAVARARELGLL